MSVSKKHKEVNEGLTNLLTHMKNDYNGWSMRGRTVHQNTEDFIRETEIREDMEKRYADGLGYEVNTKYIKVFSGDSVACFVVATETDKKFRFGDILKPASWRGPTKNFARGNILENDFRGVRWTGC
jgi:predicted RNA-binding protein (virulence factor B family)|tara:strand:- start:644 stop:1024 length:381 start_codon:yes stop_codon:yes gene_type:complete